MAIPAGLLNRTLVIKSRTTGQDSHGQPSTAFGTTVATVKAWARMPAGMSAAAERIEGARETSTVTCSFRIRYRTDITAAMRAYDGSVAYDIRQVIPDIAGRTYLDLVCESVP